MTTIRLENDAFLSLMFSKTSGGRCNDDRMFRLITSMLIDSGACRQIEIMRTFGGSKGNIDRSLRMLRAGGPESFFKPTHKGSGGGKVLNRETLENAQRLLKQGYSRSQTAGDLGVSYDTLRKTISDGRRAEPGKQHETATTKSSRDVVDAQAASGMGTACIRVEKRTLSAFAMVLLCALNPVGTYPMEVYCAPCCRF